LDGARSINNFMAVGVLHGLDVDVHHLLNRDLLHKAPSGLTASLCQNKKRVRRLPGRARTADVGADSV
jgi:hypothetical protein